MIIWRQALDVAQDAWLDDRTERWETQWVPWQAFFQVVLDEKMARGQLLVIRKEGKEEARRAHGEPSGSSSRSHGDCTRKGSRSLGAEPVSQTLRAIPGSIPFRMTEQPGSSATCEVVGVKAKRINLDIEFEDGTRLHGPGESRAV